MIDQGNLEQKLGMKIAALMAVPGARYGETYQFEDAFGEMFFVKTKAPKKDMYFKEVQGLEILQKAQIFKTPKVHYVDGEFLVTELINTRAGNLEGYKLLGESLAKLHQIKGESYGLSENNYIGQSKQINGSYDKWCEFFFDKRLLVQFQLACQNNGLSQKFQKDFMKLEKKIKELLPEIDEGPSLVHGDLWAGNVLFNQFSKPVLVDPAVYYANREVDLAMAQLFGSFPKEFFSAYQNSFPLQAGYQKRFFVYNLYHLLNHLNLFGESYLEQCDACLIDCLN